MMRQARITVLLLGLLIGGCASRGNRIVIDCPQFRQMAARVPETNVIAAIQGDVVPPSSGSGLFADRDIDAILASQFGLELKQQVQAQFQALQVLRASEERGEKRQAEPPQASMLFLSGGGQWGAFGAGYLKALNDKSQLPQPFTVTGISTGALQSFYVGAALNHPADGWLDKLKEQYSPKDEREIVLRGGLFSVLFRGAFARLGPLRKRIEDGLCPPDATASAPCPLIDALKGDPSTGRRPVLIGFVEAQSGNLLFVSATALANLPDNGTGRNRQRPAQQCLTAAAMASLAMPVHFEQVQVTSDAPSGTRGGRDTLTYYDGGVRQSVFVAFADTLVTKVLSDIAGGSREAAQPPERAIYVVRNGPTNARIDSAADTSNSALTAAWRGYALMVNQSEISSIAAMRPLFANAKMYVATADGYNQLVPDPARPDRMVPRCVKPDQVMFDPAFMACLQLLGAEKAERTTTATTVNRYPRTNGWIEIPELETMGRPKR